MTDSEFDRVEKWGERVDNRVKVYLIRSLVMFGVIFGSAVFGGIWWASAWVANTDHRIEQLEQTDNRQADQGEAVAVITNSVMNLERRMDGLAATNDRILDLLLNERRQSQP